MLPLWGGPLHSSTDWQALPTQLAGFRFGVKASEEQRHPDVMGPKSLLRPYKRQLANRKKVIAHGKRRFMMHSLKGASQERDGLNTYPGFGTCLGRVSMLLKQG